MFRLLWIVALVGIADQVTKYFALLYLKSTDIPLTPFLKFSLHLTPAPPSASSAMRRLAEPVFRDRGVCGVGHYPVHDPAPRHKRHAGGSSADAGVGWGGRQRHRPGAFRLCRGLYRCLLPRLHWPTFNIADSAITIGAVLLVLDALGITWRRRSG